MEVPFIAGHTLMSILKTTISGSPRRNSHAHVVNEIGRKIVSGVYASGETLPNDAELVEQFHVSRTVLREAMKTLSAKGLIVARARIGTRVTPQADWNYFDKDVLAWRLEAGFDREFITHLADMRLAFEPFAARLAAHRRTPEDIPAFHQHCDEMEAAEDNEAFAVADLNFHRLILKSAGNPFMFSLGHLIEAALANAFQISGPTENADRQKAGVAAHRSIANAIIDGDTETAAQATEAVIISGRDRILGALSE